MNTLFRRILAIAAAALACAMPAQALDLQLQDKIVLVTGSTSNIGYATARLFLKEGATVIINSHQQAEIDAALVRAHPRVDVLVNNVGGHDSGRVPGLHRQAVG